MKALTGLGIVQTGNEPMLAMLREEHLLDKEKNKCFERKVSFGYRDYSFVEFRV